MVHPAIGVKSAFQSDWPIFIEWFMTRVLILGYGVLGQAFYRLYHSSYQIRGVKRTSLPKQSCPLILMPIQSDGLLPHLEWADTVIFCPSSGGSDLTTFQDTYLRNMEFVIHLIQTHEISIQCFMMISSTGVYPKSEGNHWKEYSAIPLETPRQKILFQTEQALIHSNLPYVILRCGGLYGEGRGNFSWVVRKGKIRTSEMSDQFLSLVHQDDVCGVADKVLRTNRVMETYNVVDDSKLRKKDLFRNISRETGIMIVSDGPAPETSDRSIMNKKVKESLGYSFRYSFTMRFLRDQLELMR